MLPPLQRSSSSQGYQPSSSSYQQPSPPHHGVYNDHPSPLQRSFSSTSSHHSSSSASMQPHAYPSKAPHQPHPAVAPELVRLPSTASSTYSLPDPTTFPSPPEYRFGGGSAVSSGVSSSSGWTSRNPSTSRASGSVRDSVTSSSFGEYNPYGAAAVGSSSEKRHQRTNSYIVEDQGDDPEDDNDVLPTSAHPRHQPPKPLREVHHRSDQYQYQQQQPNPSTTSYPMASSSYSGRHAPHPSYSSQLPSPTSSTSHSSHIGLGITADSAVHASSDNHVREPSSDQQLPTNGNRWSDAYAGSSRSSVASGYGNVLGHKGSNGGPRGRSTESHEDDSDGHSDVSDSESESSGYGWAGEGIGSVEGAAVAMVEDGRGKIVRGEGLDLKRGPRLASELIGSTHLLLGSTPTPYLMPSFLETVLPSLVASLVVLDISACHLRSLPHELSNLYVLEELNVSNNPLGTLPASLSQLVSLRVLSANEIGCSTLPASFAALKSLHTLCLRRNRLLSLPGWLSVLPNMETLLVEDNPFAGPWKPLVEMMLVHLDLAQEPMDHHAPLLSPGGTTSTGGGSTPITDSFYLADIASPPATSPTFVIPPSPLSSNGTAEGAASQSAFASFPSPTSDIQQHPRSAPLNGQHGSHSSYQAPPATQDNRAALIASRRPSLPYKSAGPPMGSRSASNEPNARYLADPDYPSRLPEIPSEHNGRQPSDDGPVLRRMRSAGALIHLGLGLGKDPSNSSSAASTRPTSPVDGRAATPSFTSSAIGLGAPPPRMPPPKRFASLGRAAGSNPVNSATYRPAKGSDGIEELDGEDGRVAFPSTGRPATPSGGEREVSGGKEKGKWGFLKKMSMGRMRSGSGSGSSIRPSGPVHSNTTPMLDGQSKVPGLPTRPSTSMGYSTGSLRNGNGTPSSLNGAANELGRFGGPSTTSVSSLTSDATPHGLPSPGMLGAPMSRKNKRRSFLPLDLPQLNIPIPSTSPFMSSTSTFSSGNYPYLPSNVQPSSKDDSDDENDSASILESYLEQSPHDSPTMTFQTSPTDDHTFRHSSSPDQVQRLAEAKRALYLRGLRKVMGYLRDLHDLSLPANAGTPIDGPSGLDTPASQFSSAGSPVSTTPTPPLGNKGRPRRPTTGERGPPELKREFSEGSMMMPSPGGSSMGDMGRAISMTESGSGNSDESQEPEPRKFKEDKSKRAKIIAEIISTEQTYVRGLAEVVELYVKPAEALVNGIGSKETVVPLAERKIVFNGLSGLLQFHMESFLPKLEAAARPLLNPASQDDEAGNLSRAVAADVGDVFRTYNPFMKMYSTYINNFDNSLDRLKSWTVSSSSSSSSPYSTPGSPTTSTAHLATMGLSLTAVSPPLTPDLSGSGALSSAQRKRVKTFLKRARQNPRHTQINLESYLLLPVQRIPRYRMLLEDLVTCTPPRADHPYDPLEDAFEEISSLASCMNEEKRDSESRRRLVQWQARIRGKFPSPLVQPHRKLLLDGSLVLTRIVKKMTDYVEVTLPIIDDGGDNTVTSQKSVVAIECLADPETLSTKLVGVLTSDLLVLCKTQPDVGGGGGGGGKGMGIGKGGEVKVDRETGLAKDGTVDLFAVLRMQTKGEPASLVYGSTIRVVDNRAILYFEAPNTSAALTWLNAINVSFQVSRS